MKKQKGLTIIQLMVILIVAGIVGSCVVKMIINKRCEANPAISDCPVAQSALPKK